MSVVVVSTPRSLFIFAGRRCPTPSGEAGEETSTFGLVAGARSRFGSGRSRPATPEPAPPLLLLLWLVVLGLGDALVKSLFRRDRVVVSGLGSVLQTRLGLGFREVLVRGVLQPVWQSNLRRVPPRHRRDTCSKEPPTHRLISTQASTPRHRQRPPSPWPC